jgi:hypothetical protein
MPLARRSAHCAISSCWISQPMGPPLATG